ncbi:MAG: glycosyltransferase [Bacteroidia bacterium]|nr:glycosyltransferase [Bacteroidia bacterium]NNJ55580.1 glycosyltransferase [Bacteroidia bacterium]
MISILMPVKNAEPYLKGCIESIIKQSYTNWQLVAVDDSSTDNSYQILKDFSSTYSNIEVFRSNGTGIIDALRLAYKSSLGDFVHRMDADDLMPINKLELFMEHWQPKAIVSGKIKYFTDEGEIGDGFNKYQAWINGLMEANNLWKDPYLECSLPSPAWLMKRSDFEDIGAFRSSLLPEDYDLMFRIYASKIEVITIKETVHFWRDSLDRTSRNEPQYFPIAYFPIKVHYFLQIDRNTKPLLLWGAGRKGKLIAKLLIAQNEKFTWITNNQNKIGLSIYGIRMHGEDEINLTEFQTILAISSPRDKKGVIEKLKKQNYSDFFWFC